MKRYPFACITAAGLVFACSLQTRSPKVTIRAEFRESRAGTVYAQLKKCLFLTAKSANTQDSFSTGTLAGLNPGLMGVDGTVFGPYDEATLAAGVSLTVPLSQTRFRLFGIDGPSCNSKTFAQNFPLTAVVGLYQLGEVNADLSTVSKASLTATLDVDAPNKVGLSTRRLEGDNRLYLPVTRVYRGRSGVASSSSLLFLSGLNNDDGSVPFELPLANFLATIKPISDLAMAGQPLHERYDLLFSAGNKTLNELNAAYATLQVTVTGYVTGHDFSGGACLPNPVGSPDGNFEGAIYDSGTWRFQTAAFPNAGIGNLTISYPRPNSPYQWGSILTTFSAADPPAARLSLRASSFVDSTHCTGFTVTDIIAYFQE